MTTSSATNSLATLLKLEDLPVEEQAAFLDEVGSVLLESTLLSYLAAATEEEQVALEAFITAHGGTDDLLEKLVTAFPAFATTLEREVTQFQTEMQTILDTPDAENTTTNE